MGGIALNDDSLRSSAHKRKTKISHFSICFSRSINNNNHWSEERGKVPSKKNCRACAGKTSEVDEASDFWALGNAVRENLGMDVRSGFSSVCIKVSEEKDFGHISKIDDEEGSKNMTLIKVLVVFDMSGLSC